MREQVGQKEGPATGAAGDDRDGLTLLELDEATDQLRELRGELLVQYMELPLSLVQTQAGGDRGGVGGGGGRGWAGLSAAFCTQTDS